MNTHLKNFLIIVLDTLDKITIYCTRHKKLTLTLAVSLVMGLLLSQILCSSDTPVQRVYTPINQEVLADGYPQLITSKEAKTMLMFDANAFDFSSPVSSSEITSDYGNRIHPVTGVAGFHAGIDIKADQGDPITLPYKDSNAYTSVVDYVGHNPVAGNLIQLRITAPNETVIYLLYAHLMQPSNLELGSEVKVGDIVGYVGSTGSSSGPHLHIATRKLELEDDMSVTLERVNPSYVFRSLYYE